MQRRDNCLVSKGGHGNMKNRENQRFKNLNSFWLVGYTISLRGNFIVKKSNYTSDVLLLD